VNDPAVLAQYPDLFNALLVSHILDYFVHVSGLILKHGETRASGDHLGQLGDPTRRLVEKLLPVIPDDQQGEYEHRIATVRAIAREMPILSLRDIGRILALTRLQVSEMIEVCICVGKP
jgi:hypothetical protein